MKPVFWAKQLLLLSALGILFTSESALVEQKKSRWLSAIKPIKTRHSKILLMMLKT